MTSSSSLYGTTSTQNSSSSNSTSLYGDAGTPIPDSSGNVIIRGTLTVNGCAILTNCTSFSFLPLNATSIGIGASATTIDIGSGSGTTTINNQLATANYTFPVADGTSNQVLITDGSGVLSFADVQSLDTNYNIDASATSGGANLNLTGSDGTTDTVKFASGTGITVSQTNANEIAITNAGVTSITGTANQVIASASTGAITLSLPQNINTGASPTFAGATLGAITVGVATDNTITTTSGNLILKSAGGEIDTDTTSIISTNSASFLLLNFPTTVTAFNGATSLQLGANTGTTNINNDLLVDDNATITGDLAVNGGDITTTSTTANLFRTNALTVNIGSAGDGTELNGGVINIGDSGQTYATNFRGLISQNGDTTQATTELLNQTSTSPILIQSTSRRSMRGFITINDDVTGAVHSAEFVAVRKVSTAEAFITIYAEVISDSSLATFTVTDSGTALNLYATKASSNSTDIYVVRNSLGEVI